MLCLPWLHAFAAEDSRQATVRIGVFGLFHPSDLTLTAIGNSALIIDAEGQQIVVEQSSGTSSAQVTLVHGGMRLTAGERSITVSHMLINGRRGDEVSFELAVPHRIKRRYRGTLEIVSVNQSLVPIVRLNVESAVAAVVAAESAGDTPLEALKAQAIATRSYFVSTQRRHEGFDFCDTTHCQLLREAPGSASPAAKATDATRGLILSYDSHAVAAMYTHSCTGTTHTPSELHLPAGSYPYYSATCAYCRSHPVQWSTVIPSNQASSLKIHDEPARLRFVRRHGWKAVQSNDFAMVAEGNKTVLNGIGKGHGIGLCQSGAKAMAEAGALFLQILAHYYPNTTIDTYRELPHER